MRDESTSPERDATPDLPSFILRKTAERCATSRRLVEQSVRLLASSQALLENFKTLHARLLVTQTLVRRGDGENGNPETPTQS
jgi:hypothetical protein